ncbi:hypothetical protein STRDD12_01140 [Streptococcus sp. DD12]|nr:hypothetical protein STRDD12_01140 [Streptococcus sp. DD12]
MFDKFHNLFSLLKFTCLSAKDIKQALFPCGSKRQSDFVQ